MGTVLSGQNAIEGRRRAATLQVSQDNAADVLINPPAQFAGHGVADAT